MEPPTIHNCPDDITVTAPVAEGSTTVTWTPPTATDLSGAVTPTSPQNPGESFTIGSTQVTYTANDGANNLAFCRFTVTVVDQDECTSSTLCDSSSSTCLNNMGSYICMCKSGYTGSPFTPGQPFTCTDDDECALPGTNMCNSSLSTCMNTIGSYICECNPGYTGSPYTPPRQPTCTDFDECTISEISISCASSTSTCMNTIGSYICRCKSGYTGAPFTPGQQSACIDFDECTISFFSDMCDSSSSTCMNTIGSYQCVCKSGYTGSPYTPPGQRSTCTDINECLTPQSNECDLTMSDCFNRNGGYVCTCNSGFIGSQLYPSSVPQSPCQADVTPPVISGCRSDIFRTVQIGDPGATVFWTEPTATDNSGTVTLDFQSHSPGSDHLVGTTTVTYTFADPAGNVAVCTFDIIIQEDCIRLNSAGQCSLNECSCTMGTCTSQTRRCEATCSVFQCPAKLASESLSQVNPQSSVEIKCILEGSTAVVNRLEIRLSRSEQMIDDSGITQETDPDISANRREVTYRVISVSEDDQFFCILSFVASIVGSINVTGFVYNCTTLNTAVQCSPNECSCTKGTCTSQTGRCEATCSVFQCPASIASESLSQVNPQSSVEIKCILEGSTAVVNRLEIRLSRSEQIIIGNGITQETVPDISINRIEVTYRVISVSEDDQFFCILSFVASIFGSINVTGFVYKLPSISDPPTEITRTTTSVTITWRPWGEETDVGDPRVVAYIPYYKMDPSQDWMRGSRIMADQTLEYTASSLETDRNYKFSVAAVREGEGGEGPRGPPVTIKTLCIDVVPQMVTTTLTTTNDVTVTWQQPTVQCSIGITQFTIYYEIEGDVSSRKEAGTADPNAEIFTVDGSLLEAGTTYNIAVTVTTDQESALSEAVSVTRAGSEPPSSPVYLVALVIPVLLIIILLVVIVKRIRRKRVTESKPVDEQDVDYVNAGVTDDPEDYIALEEQSRNTPAPKYQDLTEKEAPKQVSRYERTILETADAAPKAMPRQGIKKQTDYQYEDVNLGETDARKLPSVPQPDLQSEDDTEYEVPDMFEEYTGVYMDPLGASKPITPRPMKITEYKTFMGRERSKVISEIVQQYTALKTGQQHPWTAAVKLQNKPKNFFKALLP